MTQPRILLSVGEASGDLHAAHLVTEIKRINPDIYFYGMGGKLMRTAGVDIIIDSTKLAIIGVVDVFISFWRILTARRTLQKVFYSAKPPDLIILVDYPTFNVHLARLAKRANIKVLYYISPKIWASRPKRIKLMKKYVDMVAVIFPFEVELYEQADIPAKYIGNPLTTIIKHRTNSTNVEPNQNLVSKPGIKTIGLLPGSRSTEINYLMPVITATAKLLTERYPNIQFILPLASSINKQDVMAYLANTNLNIKIIENDTYNTIQLCDAVITASGTAVLEIALLNVPMVIIYKTAALNYWIGKKLIKIPYIGLCNILAGKQVALELIQDNATPNKIATEVSKLLEDPDYRQQMLTEFSHIHKALVNEPQVNAADLVLELLKSAAK